MFGERLAAEVDPVAPEQVLRDEPCGRLDDQALDPRRSAAVRSASTPCARVHYRVARPRGRAAKAGTDDASSERPGTSWGSWSVER